MLRTMYSRLASICAFCDADVNAVRCGNCGHVFGDELVTLHHLEAGEASPEEIAAGRIHLVNCHSIAICETRARIQQMNDGMLQGRFHQFASALATFDDATGTFALPILKTTAPDLREDFGREDAVVIEHMLMLQELRRRANSDGNTPTVTGEDDRAPVNCPTCREDRLRQIWLTEDYEDEPYQGAQATCMTCGRIWYPNS